MFVTIGISMASQCHNRLSHRKQGCGYRLSIVLFEHQKAYNKIIYVLPWIKYFWSHVRWFLNKFHWWLRHSWKLAIHPTCDQNIVINDNPYFIQNIHVILGLKLIHVTKSGPWWASIMHYEMFQWFHSLRTTLRKTANILRWWTNQYAMRSNPWDSSCVLFDIMRAQLCKSMQAC